MKISKKIKAQSFDLMQYFYGKVHEPLIHCLIKFSTHTKDDILKRAVTLSLEAVPIFGCCLDSTKSRPFWKKRDFTGEDIVSVNTSQNDEKKQINALLSSTIDIGEEPQLNSSFYL